MAHGISMGLIMRKILMDFDGPSLTAVVPHVSRWMSLEGPPILRVVLLPYLTY